ncbi:hypothetical protein ACOME3_002747 [Neoechinorhynchus agilis]
METKDQSPTENCYSSSFCILGGSGESIVDSSDLTPVQHIDKSVTSLGLLKAGRLEFSAICAQSTKGRTASTRRIRKRVETTTTTIVRSRYLPQRRFYSPPPHKKENMIHSPQMVSQSSRSFKQERGVTEISHGNDTIMAAEEQYMEHKPILVKELIETVELCKPEKWARPLIEHISETCVTMVKDGKPTMIDCCEDGTGRVDLETLYIVETNDGDGEVERGNEDENETRYDLVTRVKSDATFRTTMIIYHNGHSLDKEKGSLAPRKLTPYEKREFIHLDVGLAVGMEKFSLPRSIEEVREISNDLWVSVNYQLLEDGRLLGCERRPIHYFAKPIREMIIDSVRYIANNLKDTSMTFPVLVVSHGERKGIQDRSYKEEDVTYALMFKYGSMLDLKESISEDQKKDIVLKIWKYRNDEQTSIKILQASSVTEIPIHVEKSSTKSKDDLLTLPTSQQLRKATKLTLSPIQIAHINGQEQSGVAGNLETRNELNKRPLAESLTGSANQGFRMRLSPYLSKTNESEVPIEVSKKQEDERLNKRQIQAPKPISIPVNFADSIGYQKQRLIRDGQNGFEYAKALAAGYTSNRAPSTHDRRQISVNMSNRKEVHLKEKSLTLPKKAEPRRRARADQQYERSSRFARSTTNEKRQPIVLQRKEMVGQTLDQLRKSIRRHPQDTYQAISDDLPRSSSWGHLNRNSRQVRAKLIPVLHSGNTREYFARVEDYLNDFSAQSIRRSYSMSYLQKGGPNRMQWIRIPGEVIKIEEERVNQSSM